MIIFRHVTTDLPEHWLPVHWYVEYHHPDWDAAFPCGTAYVSVFPTLTSLDFLWVAPQFRREGIGVELICACRERWPDIILTDACTEEGEAFLKSLEGSCSS